MHFIQFMKLQEQILKDLCDIKNYKSTTDKFLQIKEIFSNSLDNINILECLPQNAEFLLEKNFNAMALLVRQCLINDIPNPSIEICVALDFIHYIQKNVDNELIYNNLRPVLSEFLYIAIINTLNFNYEINSNKIEEILAVLNSLDITWLNSSANFKYFYVASYIIACKLKLIIEDMHILAKYSNNLVSEAIIYPQFAIDYWLHQHANLWPNFYNVLINKIMSLEGNYSLESYNNICEDFVLLINFLLFTEDIDENIALQMMLTIHAELMQIKKNSFMNNTLLFLDKFILNAKSLYQINTDNYFLKSSFISSFIITLSIVDKELFSNELNLAQLYKWLIVNKFYNADDIFIKILNNLEETLSVNDKKLFTNESLDDFICLFDDFYKWKKEHIYYELLFKVDIDLDQIYKLYKSEYDNDKKYATREEFLECVYINRYADLTEILTLWQGYGINWDHINDRLKDEIILGIIDNCIMLDVQKSEVLLKIFMLITENIYDLKINLLINKLVNQFKDKFENSKIFRQLIEINTFITEDAINYDYIEKEITIENVLIVKEENIDCLQTNAHSEDSRIDKVNGSENISEATPNNIIKIDEIKHVNTQTLEDSKEENLCARDLQKENSYKTKNNNIRINNKEEKFGDIFESKQLLFKKAGKSNYESKKGERPSFDKQHECIEKLENIVIQYYKPSDSNKFDSDYKFVFIEIMNTVLKFDNYHFYIICIAVPEIADILDNMPDNEIKKLYLEKQNSLNLESINEKLDKSMKKLLYTALYNSKIKNYNEFIPYINFINNDNEFLLLLYLKYTSNFDDGFVEFIANRIKPEFFSRLDANTIKYLNATLSLHSIYSANKKYTNNLLLKLSSQESVLNILDANYFYCLPWYMFVCGLQDLSESSEKLNVFFKNLNIFSTYYLRTSFGEQNFINTCIADIFIFFVTESEKITKLFIEKFNMHFKTSYTLPSKEDLKYIVEERIIDYLNIQPNVIVSCILRANEEQLSYIITEKTLGYNELKYVSRLSLINLLLEIIDSRDKLDPQISEIKIFIEKNSRLFNKEIINSINKYAGFDENGCVASPNILPISIFVKHDTITHTLIAHIRKICILPKILIELISPETFTMNILFNGKEQINLFIMFCLCDMTNNLNTHKELIVYLLDNFNTLSVMDGKLSYLAIMMRFERCIDFIDDNNFIEFLKKNAFNQSFEPMILEIGINSISKLNGPTPTIGGDFITMPVFSCEFIMKHKKILDNIDPKILKEYRNNSNDDQFKKPSILRTQNSIKISNFLKNSGKEEIVTYLQELQKRNMPKAKLR